MAMFGGSMGGHWGFGRATPTIEGVPRGGALVFDGTFTENLGVLSSDLGAIGTQDFTMQWWQYLEPSNSPENANAFIFSMGGFISDSAREFVAFWLDRVVGDTTGIWANLIVDGSQMPKVRLASADVENQWVHFAVVRQGLTLRMYMNGTQIGTQTRGSIDNLPLPNPTVYTAYTSIGSQFSPGQPTGAYGNTFRGRLALFEWVRGAVRYPDGTSFRPPLPLAVEPLPDGKTRLLLRVESEETFLDDSSGLDRTIFMNGTIEWIDDSP